MPTTYAKNKVHIYNYVEKNREKWNEYSKNYMKNYINENREDFTKKRMERYYYEKSFNFDVEVKRLMSIKI